MSLIVWYPFTKDFKNQGLSNISESVGSGVSIINSNGFGKSASFSNASNDYIRLDNFPSNETFGKTTWSLSFWIKYKNNGNRGVILGSYSTSAGNINIEINGNSKTDNSLRLYWYANTPNLNYQSSLTLDANSWVHVAITYDGTDLKFYKNGNLEDTKTATLNYGEIADNWYFGTDNRLSNNLIGELNDFRIYNHTLSIKEIKELSKGLILHHALKGNGANPNILPNPMTYGSIEYESDMGQTVYIRDTTATTESYLSWGRTPQVEKSTEYTFSCMIWINDNVKSVDYYWLSDTEADQKTGSSYVNITSKGNNILTPNKWNYVTWTFTTKANDYTGYIRLDNNGSKTEGEHAILKACCPKLEKGSKATPYIPYTDNMEIKNIPAEYSQVEYIEGTGTQYIDTGYIHKATTRVDIVCELKETTNCDYRALFGARNGTYQYNSFNFFTIFGYVAKPVFSRTGNEKAGTGLLYNEKILVSAYDKTCSWYKYGSTTTAGSVTTTGTADAGFNKMLLFGLNKATTADGITIERGAYACKIYSCKIWDDNGTTLVRDFVPVMRKSDMVLGLYDMVNNNFHTNIGTGVFLTSPNIIEEDLSGNGYNGTRQGVSFTADSPRYFMSTEFDTNKDLLLEKVFHEGDEVSNLSVSIWVNFTSSYTSGTNNCFWNLAQNSFLRVERTGNNEIKVIAAIGESGYQYFSILSKTITTNVWHHFVLTFDKGIIKFYMNGNLETTSDKTNIGTYLKCRGNFRWSLGDYTQTNNKFTGKLSDFRIYAKTLTLDDVKELYQNSASIDKSGKVYCGELIEE